MKIQVDHNSTIVSEFESLPSEEIQNTLILNNTSVNIMMRTGKKTNLNIILTPHEALQLGNGIISSALKFLPRK